MPLLRRARLALPLCLLACSPEPQTRVTVHDLAALLPVAEAHREVGAIDFGSAVAREHLASGWHRNERGKDGASFVWSRGAASEVRFFLAAPRALRAELRGAPIPTEDGRPQSMRVELNGRPLGTVELSPGMRVYIIALPRAAQVAGMNRLTFRYRVVSAPHPDNGRRQLALQVDLLRFRPAHQPGAAPPRSGKGALVLPFGTEVVYDLHLPGAADLALPRIAAEGSGTDGRLGHLVIEAREEGGSPEVHELAPGSSARSVELPGSGPRLLRLTLRAVAPSPGDGGGYGGLALWAPVVRAARPQGERRAEPGPRPWSGRPNVILYLVDTLRADRLGCYGAVKPVSPAIDGFAGGATLFERAVAQSSWTRPSVTSVLTGLGPLAHGVKTLDDRLSDAAVTLPELLRAAGYRTAAFSTNPHVSAATGLAQGFDHFELLTGDPSSAAVNRRVLGWLAGPSGNAENADKASPFFLYIHTIDPHAPYEPPFELLQRFAPGVLPDAGSVEEIRRAYLARGEERSRRMAQLSALYDAEVAANDRSFGELLAELRRRGLYDDALIVFAADHGEELGEHGDLGHGQNLYGQTLDVPLIVKWPRQTRGGRVPHLAQQLDLLPTLMSAAGLRPPPGLPGADLFTLGPGRRAFSHLSYEGRDGMSLTEGDWKLILPLSRKFGLGPELYRRGDDRGERVNRAASDDVRAGWLRAQIRLELLRSRAAGEAPAPRAEIDEETRKALEALGYL
jgi:arylsulfatase A-like enzyme